MLRSRRDGGVGGDRQEEMLLGFQEKEDRLLKYIFEEFLGLDQVSHLIIKDICI